MESLLEPKRVLYNDSNNNNTQKTLEHNHTEYKMTLTEYVTQMLIYMSNIIQGGLEAATLSTTMTFGGLFTARTSRKRGGMRNFDQLLHSPDRARH